MAGASEDDFVHEHWSSRSAFLLATIGAAVGLGNLWRFPFIAGENGGGAFVLIYLGFVVLLCVPIMTAELAMGRRGGGSAVRSMHHLVAETRAKGGWVAIGWLSILIPLIGISFYSVVAGWSIDYVFKAALNRFSGFDPAGSQAAFDRLLSSPWRLLFMHGLFMATAVFIVARGVGRGIEVIARFMMPALFVILLVLAGYSVLNADIMGGLEFMFYPDFSKLTFATLFLALGQAFFSLAIGVGVLMTYAAYVPKNVSLPGAALVIGLVDTGVAVLAGIAIFPLVFANHLDPSGGPGLIFVTLPIAFGNMSGGYLMGLLFFILLFFAAFSTVIGMLEPVVSWLEEHASFTRPKVAVAAGVFGWVLGISAALSFNLWGDVRPLSFLAFARDRSIFDSLDFVVSDLLLPINGLLIAIFAGWVLTHGALRDELQMGNDTMFRYVRFVLRYLAPLVIGVVFYTSLW